MVEGAKRGERGRERNFMRVNFSIKLRKKGVVRTHTPFTDSTRRVERASTSFVVKTIKTEKTKFFTTRTKHIYGHFPLIIYRRNFFNIVHLLLRVNVICGMCPNFCYRWFFSHLRWWLLIDVFNFNFDCKRY